MAARISNHSVQSAMTKIKAMNAIKNTINKGQYSDEDCYGHSVSLTDAKFRQRQRMSALVKQTVGDHAVKSLSDWMVKCLVKLDKDRWQLQVHMERKLAEVQNQADDAALRAEDMQAAMNAKIEELDRLLAEDRLARAELEEKLHQLQSQVEHKNGVIKTMETVNANIISEKAELKDHIVQEREILEHVRRHNLLEEVQDMTSALRQIRYQSSNSPSSSMKETVGGYVPSSPTPTLLPLTYPSSSPAPLATYPSVNNYSSSRYSHASAAPSPLRTGSYRPAGYRSQSHTPSVYLKSSTPSSSMQVPPSPSVQYKTPPASPITFSR